MARNTEQLKDFISQTQVLNEKLNQNASLSDISEFLPQYKRILNKTIPPRQKHHLSIDTVFEGRDSHSQFHLQVISSSFDKQMVAVKVDYGRNTFILYLLILDSQSPAHSLKECEAGCFSTVYLAQMFQKDVAIKCTSTKLYGFKNTLIGSIKQYVICCLASALEAGPYMQRTFGFDLIIYKDCIEFVMELCSCKVYKQFQTDELKKSLSELHRNHIVHYDIKPDNLAFSPKYQKFVFIDFGLSQIVPETIGQKQFRLFRGTLMHCSPEYQRCYTSGPCYVDSYYNDAHCLQKSIHQIKNIMKQKWKEEESDGLYSLPNEYLIYLIRYYLFNHYRNEHLLESLANKYMSLLLREYRHEIVKILCSIPYNRCLSKMYIRFIRDFKTNQIYMDSNHPYQVQHHSPDEEDELQNGRIIIKYNQIANVHRNTDNIVRVRPVELLQRRQMVLKLEQSNYMVMLSKCLRIESTESTYEEKMRICVIMKNILLPDPEIPRQSLLDTCILFLFDHCFTTSATPPKIKILATLVISISILQIKTQQEFMHSFQDMLNMNIQFVLKLEILMKYLQAVELMRYRLISGYDQRYLEDEIYTNAKRFLDSHGDTDEVERLYRFYFRFVINTRYLKEEQLNYQIQSQKNCKEIMGLASLPIILHYPGLKSLFSYYCSIIYRLGRESFKLRQHNLRYFLEKKLDEENHVIYPTLNYLHFQLGIEYNEIYSTFKFAKNWKIYEKAFLSTALFNKYEIYYHHILAEFRSNRLNTSPIYQSLRLIQQFKKRDQIKYFFLFICCLPGITTERIEELGFSKEFWKKILEESYHEARDQRRIHIHSLDCNVKTSLYILIITKKLRIDAKNSNYESKRAIKYLSTFIDISKIQMDSATCIKCKVMALTELCSANFDVMFYQNRHEDHFQAYSSLIMFCMKNKQLSFNRNIIMKSRMLRTIPKYREKTILLSYQYIKVMKCYRMYLQDSNLSDIYILLYRMRQYESIKELLEYLFIEISIQSEQKTLLCQSSLQFYTEFSLVINNLIHSEQQKRQFFHFHIPLLQHWKNSKNFYLSLFFNLILNTRNQATPINFAYIFISRSLNILDSHTRQLIFQTFYTHCRNDFAVKNPRKSEYLNKMHLKYTHERMSSAYIISQRIKKTYVKQRIHKIKFNSFHHKLERYYQYIGKDEFVANNKCSQSTTWT